MISLHHIEITCSSIEETAAKLSVQFGFCLFCRHAVLNQICLKLSSVHFLLREDLDCLRDHVSDVAFEVKDETFSLDLARRYPSATSIDCEGVHIIRLASPLPLLQHSILFKRDFTGDFAPGFKRCTESTIPEQYGSDVDQGNRITALDHLALVSGDVSCQSLISWYSDVFGYAFNTEKGYLPEGMIKTRQLGMMLWTMEVPQCPGCPLLVLSESIPGQKAPNQLDLFVSELTHGGVQHLAFASDSILDTVFIWRRSGVNFISNLPDYYSKLANLYPDQVEFIKCLQDTGVLFDIETNGSGVKSGALLQIFTSSIFKQKTLFFEVIERRGANGFGFGNIAALWKSLETSETDSHSE